MKKNDSAILSEPEVSGGYQVSAEPVVPRQRQDEQAVAEKFARMRASKPAFGTDLFYVLPRDPQTLFAYWDLNWEQLFESAGLEFQSLFLRVLREDGAEESTVEIDPLSGQYFASVALAGANYRAEIGCYDGLEWRSLAASEAVALPASAAAEDWDAEFATLPLHLTFQHLLELFRASDSDQTQLAETVAKVQSKVRALVRTAHQTGDEIDRSSLGLGEIPEEEFVALFGDAAAPEDPPTLSRETIERWSRLAQPSDISSWSGGLPSSPTKKVAR